jgi:hypothetical protein
MTICIICEKEFGVHSHLGHCPNFSNKRGQPLFLTTKFTRGFNDILAARVRDFLRNRVYSRNRGSRVARHEIEDRAIVELAETTVKDIHTVLAQKQQQFQILKQQIEALQIVVPMLADDPQRTQPSAAPPGSGALAGADGVKRWP